MTDITFVIFTFNEEKRIERVIRNFLGAGDILVVDNHSSDATVQIAEAYGCKVLLNKNQGWVEDPITTSLVKENVKTPWIYWGYADELVERATLNKITETIADPSLSIIEIYRKNWYYGRFCYDAFSHKTQRIFKKNAIDFSENTIHHFGRPIVPLAEVHTLPRNYFVHHFISNTAKSYLAVLDRYTDIEADNQKVKVGVARAMFVALKLFFGNYFYRGGYKAGMAGMFLSMFMGWYPLLKFMKQFERSGNLSEEQIEVINNQVREEILLGFSEQNKVPADPQQRLG